MPDGNPADSAPNKLRVAAIQMQVVSGEPRKNMVRAEAMLNEAARQGAQAALLPELWTTGYALERFEEIAQDCAEMTLRFLREEARRLNMAIVGGSFPTKQPDGVYSTCHVIGPDGSVIAVYSKEHLFPLLSEPKYLRPGKPGTVTNFKLPIADTGVANNENPKSKIQNPKSRWATLICFDIRFPESTRQLAYKGARVLWIPSEWPHPRLEHWRTLLRARAIENQLFVVAANRTGHGDNSNWCGHSTIIDPWGNILAEAEEEETVLAADLDMGLVDEVRGRIPCFEVIED